MIKLLDGSTASLEKSKFKEEKECLQVLKESGYTGKQLVYLIRDDVRFYLKIGSISIGYVEGNEESYPESLFNSLIKSIISLYGKFDCFIFPNSRLDWKYKEWGVIIHNLKKGLDCGFDISISDSKGLRYNELNFEADGCKGQLRNIIASNLIKLNFDLSDKSIGYLLKDLNCTDDLYGSWFFETADIEKIVLKVRDYCSNWYYVVITNSCRNGCDI